MSGLRFVIGLAAIVIMFPQSSAWSADAASEACLEQAESEFDASTLRFLQRRLAYLRTIWANGNYAHQLDGGGIYRRSGLEATIESHSDQLARLIAQREDAFVPIRAGENSATNIRDAIEFFAEQGYINQIEDQLEALEIWFVNLEAKKQSLRDRIAEAEARLERLREWYAFEVGDVILEITALIGPTAAAEHCLDEVNECQSHVLTRYGPFDETADNIERLLQLRGQLVTIDPPPYLPAEIAIDEDPSKGTATLHVTGWQRWIADTSVWALGLTNVFASFEIPLMGINPVGLNALQNAAGYNAAFLTNMIAAGDDVELPIEEARQVYENYYDLKNGNMRDRALREQSCMIARLDDHIATQRQQLADDFADVETSLDLPACRDFAHDILDMDEERRRFREHDALADPALFEMPTYSLDLTGCTSR